MADMNRVMLMGFVSSDIEVGYINEDENRPACRFGMATHESYATPETGEVKNYSTFHTILFYGKTVNFIKEYIENGDNIFVEGKIRVRQYESKNGGKATAFEIVGSKVEILSKKRARQQAKQEQPPLDSDDNIPY
ncbi:MAG: single-stranded DNA-binding protein [Neisseriaceae bacterium]|nr:single-stranded DNA-binding protein [Neisseriaceae bacterium]